MNVHTCIGPRFAHLSLKGATELVSVPAPAPVLLELLECMVTPQCCSSHNHALNGEGSLLAVDRLSHLQKPWERKAEEGSA